ncbi:MAG: acyl-CoA dehydrogenase family protein [Deltaproteobacteria bacterium]|nr:acyl-CoA dehydrogenase family protein [Deltaproteobacteria bacterium]
MSDPNGTEQELIARARALAPGFAARATECERARRIPEKSIGELKEAGLFRLLQPKAFGGHEADFATYVRVCIELGRGCASTAWVYQNNAMHQLILSLFPEATQRAIWATGDPELDGWIASTGWSPKRGFARPVDGGYVLDGHWEFASGSYNCDLDLILAPVVREGAGPIPEMRLFLLERAKGEYEIVDTWHAMGLKGTASNDILVREQFVAEDRTLRWADANRTPEAGVKTQGHAVHDGPWYRVPVWDWMGWTIVPALLGAVYAALDSTVARLESRKNLLGEKLADTQAIQLRLADVAATLDAAETLLLRDVEKTGHAYGSGRGLSVLERSVCRRNQAYCARLVFEAAGSLLYRGGAHGIRDDDPVQRAYRDVGAGVTHVGTDWDVWGRINGQALMGQPIMTPNFGFHPAEIVQRR